jgi:acyl carrier protein
MITTDLAAIEDSVRGYVTGELVKGKEAAELADDTDLVRTGLVDSINVLGLVSFVEEAYDIELEPGDVQRMRSISEIARVVAGKLAG